VVAEYLAEGAIAPIVMIRRGRHKFIHSPADPDQLFDLGSDRTSKPTWPAIWIRPAWAWSSGGRSPRAGTSRPWTVRSAGASSGGSLSARRSAPASRTPWDFTPAYNASRRYIRNHMDLADLEEMARFPPVEHGTPLA